MNHSPPQLGPTLNPETEEAPPSPEELRALLRLLDDETPAVRQRVTERLSLCGGDISEWFATQPGTLEQTEREILMGVLRCSRRESLMKEWVVPTGGAAALAEDWETMEALLRTLSDFLHDGLSLRQPLGDALDLLAEEAEEAGIQNAKDLRAFLFKTGRLRANKIQYFDHRNSDLAWAIAEGLSNPIGLCLIFMLVGKRMGFEIEGVNFPGHFMCRIYEGGHPIIIDCFDAGQLHLQSTLLESHELTKHQRQLLRQGADAGTILLRVLSNLLQAFQEEGSDEDARLVEKLKQTLA